MIAIARWSAGPRTANRLGWTLAIVLHDQLAYELTYFWSLEETIQSMLTPDLDHDFPEIELVTFFISHGGILVAALRCFGCARKHYKRKKVWIFTRKTHEYFSA